MLRLVVMLVLFVLALLLVDILLELVKQSAELYLQVFVVLGELLQLARHLLLFGHELLHLAVELLVQTNLAI